MNNYSEGGTSSDNGWESILNAFVNNNNDNTSNANNNNGNNNRRGGSLTPTTAVPPSNNNNNNNNINDGYAAYLQATYQLNNTTNQQKQDNSTGGISDIGGSSNYSPLNYNTNPKGYSLNMPSTQYNNNNPSQYNTQQQHNSLSPAPINNGYGASNSNGSTDIRGRERSNSNNSLQLDPYSTLIDYQPTPINQMQQPASVNGIGAGNNMGAQQGGNGLDYCDALLQGMDDSSFNWLAGAFGATAPNNNNNNAASLGGNNNGGFYTATNNQFGGGGFVGEQMALPTGGVGIQHNLPTGGIRHNIPNYPMQQQQGMVGMGNNQNNELAAYFMAQQQQQGMMGMAQQAAQFQQQQQQQVAAQQGKKKGRRSKSATTSRSRSTTTGRGRGRGRKSKSLLTSPEVIGSLGISSLHLPTGRDHSSLPSHQIDPLLDTITLTVSAVSLTPLNGNEVVRHIRTKTDDVITRFLPCVDFLVNCQQELRQGLQIAQRSQTAARRAHVTTGRRGGNGMTSRQFHSTYVAPLPKRFEKLNETLMAREYLIEAKIAMEVLVHDANTAIPQGCEQVKNAFLGGMRENESWGLRKWLSKHGGANSICNDLEEVHRNVKALKKDEQTTIRLAGMLRPIAKQAHDRLKKDVPQAYQEQSSAHPYLPFFHRLEACLKQMATYDPEKEDDVICLDLDSSDDDEAVKVVSKSPLVASSMSSSPVKKEGGKTSSKNLDVMKRSQKRSSNEDIAKMTNSVWGNDLKRSKTSGMANDVFNDANKVAATSEEDKKPKSTPKKEVEIICLDDSSDEEEAPPPPAANKRSTIKDESNNSAFESSSHGLEVLDAATFSPEPQETSRPPPQCNLNTAVSKGGAGGSSKWRCTQCTYLNEAFATKCSMCEDSE